MFLGDIYMRVKLERDFFWILELNMIKRRSDGLFGECKSYLRGDHLQQSKSRKVEKRVFQKE